MLAQIIPEARVFTYDYNANYHSEAPVETLLGHADTLLKLLNHERSRVKIHTVIFGSLSALTTGQDQSNLRPLVFVASCFGGLVLAEVSLLATLKILQRKTPKLPFLYRL